MASKQRINYWIDIGLAITFIISFVTGIIKWPGLFRTMGWSYEGLPMLLLTKMHDRSGLIMGLLVLLHIILHFKWMAGMTKNLFRKKGKNTVEKAEK